MARREWVRRFAGVAILLALATPTAHGQAVVATTPMGASSSTPVSPEERHAMVEALLARWGAYAQDVIGVDLDVWRERLRQQSVVADATNLRAALSRDTLEGAMATLVGRGGVAGRFGDVDQDLGYTPVAPCRILDTRNTVAGAIAANTVRSFQAIDRVSFADQGGSATDCGTLGLSATAVAVNLTAVTPATAGFATVFPFGTPPPTTASLNYDQGAVTNNTVIAAIPNPPAASDVSLFSFAQSHYVADIVGYFAPPHATAIECIETPPFSITIGPFTAAAAFTNACDAGYTHTSMNCESASFLMPLVIAVNGQCAARNNGPTAATLRASRTCCRAPGR